MVHTFEINGCYFALDVESGALHMLEKPAFEICSRLKAPLSKTPPDWIYGLGLEKEEAELSYSELYSVYEEGLLFAPDFKVNVSSNQEIPVKLFVCTQLTIAICVAAIALLLPADITASVR